MKKLLLIMIITTLVSEVAFAQIIKKPSYIPVGWKIPSSENFVANSGWAYFLSNGNALPFYTSGDFNGDLVPDFAWTLIKADGSSWEVFAFISNTNKGFDRIDMGGKRNDYDHPTNLYTGNVANTELTILRKGEKICRYDDNMVLLKAATAPYDAVMFGVYEGDRAAYVYNPATKSFVRFSNCSN